MEEKKLMIGNLLTFGNQICKIIEIQEDCFYVENEEKERYKNTSSLLEPIPLTDEWLKRLGLKRLGNRNMWIKDNICVVLESHNDLGGNPTKERFYIGFKDLSNVLYHTTIPCDHVHTLQNAFTLTGGKLVLDEK